MDAGFSFQKLNPSSVTSTPELLRIKYKWQNQPQCVIFFCLFVLFDAFQERFNRTSSWHGVHYVTKYRDNLSPLTH